MVRRGTSLRADDAWDGSQLTAARELRLREHGHAGHIYGSKDEQREVAAAFFRAALIDQVRSVYIHDEPSPDSAVGGLRSAGLDVSEAVRAAAFEVVDHGILPSRPGELTVDGLIGFVESRVQQARTSGYPGVRGVGDMSWALSPDPTLEELIRYESACTALLGENPVSAICQYDRVRFGDSTLFDVVCSHPWLVISSTVCQNPYFVPSTSFPERDRGTMSLDAALGNVLAREREERWLAVAEVAELAGAGLGLGAGEPAARAVDVARLAAIYEHMRDYKQALRDRVRWRLERQPGGRRSITARAELTALDAEIEWLEERASLWRRRELLSSGLFFDPVTGTMAFRGGAMGLSRLEASLLRVLLDQAGRPCQASQLLRSAWEGDVRTEAQLRNYIVRLRQKLEILGVPASIVTLRGRGYCLSTSGGAPEAG